MTSSFTVFVHLPGQVEAVPAGQLRMEEQGAQVLSSRFQYGDRYVTRRNRLALDPLSLALGAPGEVQAMREPPLGAAGPLPQFGVFRDAAPDLWGRRVIENKLRRTGPLPESLYLRHAGSNRVGALDFRESPDSPPLEAPHVELFDLEYLLEASRRVEEGEPVAGRLALLFEAGPSMGGARPKAVIRHEGREWLLKFSARDDRFDVPAVEFATLQMARDAGLDVPMTELVQVNGRHVLMIERFDRTPVAGGMARHAFASALSLLALHELDSPTASYADIVTAITRHGARGGIVPDVRELFARMVFNILVHNNDDHLRNHGFLWHDEQPGWRLSPLYDVVPAPVIGLERDLHLGVGREGRRATLTNAMSRHELFQLSRAEALALIDRQVRVVREWKTRFEAAGVGERDIAAVAGAFQHPRALGAEEL